MSKVKWWAEWLTWTLAALCIALGPVWPGEGEETPARPPVPEPACQCVLVLDVEPARAVLA